MFTVIIESFNELVLLKTFSTKAEVQDLFKRFVERSYHNYVDSVMYAKENFVKFVFLDGKENKIIPVGVASRNENGPPIVFKPEYPSFTVVSLQLAIVITGDLVEYLEEILNEYDLVNGYKVLTEYSVDMDRYFSS